MTQKSPSKQFLLDPIENHRNIYQLTKTSMANLTPIQNSIGINTELHRDIGINTPNYAEQTTRDIDKGNTVDEIPEIFMEAEASETYWKLMTEQRRQAIQETHIENQQLHSLIDELSSENDKLCIIANHCDYLQNILETLTAENDSLLNETNVDDSRID